MMPSPLNRPLGPGAAVLASAALLAGCGTVEPVTGPDQLALAPTDDAVVFENVGLPGATPLQAHYVHFHANPVIEGDNLYAPTLVDMGDHWRVYYGGWAVEAPTAEEHRDYIYLAETETHDLAGPYHPAGEVIDGGDVYTHVNDPAVVHRQDTGQWVMAYTVFEDYDWIMVSTSDDGINWSPDTFEERQEVVINGMEFDDIARPSLIWNGDYNDGEGRWEMYFDANPSEEDGVQFLAVSQQEVPLEWELEAEIGHWRDADIKRLPDGKYIAAFRHGSVDLPWSIQYAESDDGINFTDHVTFLDRDPLNDYDDDAVSNPGWAIDNDGVIRAVLFGGSDDWIADHQIGIAFPQLGFELAGNGAEFADRQAVDADRQLIYVDPGFEGTLQRMTVTRSLFDDQPLFEGPFDGPVGSRWRYRDSDGE